MDARELIRVRQLVSSGMARTIRLEAKLSLREMGQGVGVDRSTIFRWEQSQRRPRGEAAIRYLHLLLELSGA